VSFFINVLAGCLYVGLIADGCFTDPKGKLQKTPPQYYAIVPNTKQIMTLLAIQDKYKNGYVCVCAKLKPQKKAK
jgi:hypothetical protein